MASMKPIYRDFGGLRVALLGGSDGSGGGNGPLVVLLHGFGAPGTDLVPLAQFLPVPPGTRFAFPAAPISLGGGLDFSQGDFGVVDSRAWWLIDVERFQRLILSGGGDVTALIEDVPDGMLEARTQLLSALDEIEAALAVPRGQVVLGGFSQGAMLALEAALHSDRALRGLVLLSGTLLSARQWLARMPGRRGLPVLQSHGRQDALLPFFLAEKLRDHLTAAGLSVDFIPFAGGHEIPPPVLRGASRFLQQVLPTNGNGDNMSS
jgi:phospholipase/carboxylesterase